MRHSILLVDDSDDVRVVLSEALTQRGYDVVACWNGRDALDRVQRSKLHPVVILLDMRMPIMDGWEFLEARRFAPSLVGVPVVVLTSEPRPDGKLPAGVSAWLPKAARLEEMVRSLENARDTRARGRRRARAAAWIAAGAAAIALAIGPGIRLASSFTAKRSIWAHAAAG